MAIKFQYNKTSLGELGKQLKVREKALPTIKSKESALRLEVAKAKEVAESFEKQLADVESQYDYMTALWGEFDPDLVSIEDVSLDTIKIAGVRIPVLKDITFANRSYDLFSSPAWTADGVELLQQIARLMVEYEVFDLKMRLLDRARKKTTQKVNLYEKVQIPGYQDAIRKIKRFLEDEENLSKSAQKIVKSKHQQEE
ncbi:MAG: V-type ATP synthase subunit D [Rikenellaceae bacterium]|nr:V-type ATP synthase subunit D [Rikenellaceae bacterium]MBR2333412.1 V-type ATP synthase subunit D [Rikenellaceae bacterium]MBR2451969.1 V-type ATP synthase subunit D [Rikenellaceae bacterium]